MRYDTRQVHDIVRELREKLAHQEHERLLSDPKVVALKKRHAALAAKLKPLQAEEKTLRADGAALGIVINTDGETFSVKRSGYNNPMPEAAVKAPRVRTFAQLERKVSTAMVGGDRAEVRAALETLVRHVDSD